MCKHKLNYKLVDVKILIMEFAGEHLLPGKIGHFFVILGFVASLLATIFFYTASCVGIKNTEEKNTWLRFARGAFLYRYFQ
ncbi:MAG: hypothetical protein IPJ81_04745 [Chitinophagaceae bacterium]|nr:hypothetical protein [Chitinophagaceae bacterium]